LSFDSALNIFAVLRIIYCVHACRIVAIQPARRIGNVTVLLRPEIAQMVRAKSLSSRTTLQTGLGA
jgi:hypothetical protein